MKPEDAFSALIQACHRALDDLRRLDATKPVVSVNVGRENRQTACGECIVYRWRSTEAGNAEERCFIVGAALGAAIEAIPQPIWAADFLASSRSRNAVRADRTAL
jgi:hypothetical protein